MSIRAFLIVTLLCVAANAHAAGSHVHSPGMELFSSTCTDSYDLPAIPDPTVVSNEANWDTFAEAVNVRANFGASAQTAGDPDGWCDSKPWVVRMNTFNIAGDTDLWMGPFRFGANGFILFSDFDAIGTNAAFKLSYPSLSGETTPLTILDHTVTTSLAQEAYYYGPVSESSTNLENMQQGPIPDGDVYLRVDLNGAGNWTLKMSIVPVMD